MEGFSNVLRNELLGTDIRLLVMRPGFVHTNFHFDRMGQNEEKFEGVFEGMTPITAGEIADSIIWMLQQPDNISIKALDMVPTSQRSLTQVDREWNQRNNI